MFLAKQTEDKGDESEVEDCWPSAGPLTQQECSIMRL